jgi:hypothetical protein
MRNEILEFLKTKETIIPRFKEWLKDTSVPLDERWDTFIESDLGDTDECESEPPCLDGNNKTLYDDFYCDRGQTMTAKSYVDICEDKSFGDIVEIKEHFLSNFMKSFDNDW